MIMYPVYSYLFEESTIPILRVIIAFFHIICYDVLEFQF